MWSCNVTRKERKKARTTRPVRMPWLKILTSGDPQIVAVLKNQPVCRFRIQLIEIKSCAVYRVFISVMSNSRYVKWLRKIHLRSGRFDYRTLAIHKSDSSDGFWEHRTKLLLHEITSNPPHRDFYNLSVTCSIFTVIWTVQRPKERFIWYGTVSSRRPSSYA